MDTSIPSHPHHNFVEGKFLYFWKLFKKAYTVEFNYILMKNI